MSNNKDHYEPNNEMWNFRPLFTIQPNLQTREKQMKIWKDIIIQCAVHTGNHVIHIETCPLFKNEIIDRELSLTDRNTIINHIITNGNAEWIDNNHKSIRIFIKKIDVIANDIYDWIKKIGGIGTVYTIYELTSGDDFLQSSFYDNDTNIIRRALEILEKDKKCVLISGSTNDDDGVKFIN